MTVTPLARHMGWRAPHAHQTLGTGAREARILGKHQEKRLYKAKLL